MVIRFTLVGSCCLALLLAAPGCRDAGGTPKDATAAGEARSVTTIAATPRNLERAITVFGSFLAQEQATISTKVAGRLQDVQVDIGTAVKAGAPLAQVERREYEMRVRQAEAALAQALARLALSPADEAKLIEPDQISIVRQAKAVLDEALANRDRIAKLHQQGVLSQAELDTAQAGYTVAENRYQDAIEDVRQRCALVAQRRIERDIAAQQLTDSTLLAPFNAAVQDRRASPGEYLRAGDPVLTLIQMNPLRLRLEVSERDAPLINTGQVVRARVEGIVKEHAGQLVRISPAIDQLRRVLIVEADLPNDGTLHPGMFARAELVVNASEPAVTVPTNALVTFAGLEKVFTIVEGKARERVIATGRRGGNWIEVSTNLHGGEQVILDPGGLQNGQPVTTASGSIAPPAPRAASTKPPSS